MSPSKNREVLQSRKVVEPNTAGLKQSANAFDRKDREIIKMKNITFEEMVLEEENKAITDKSSPTVTTTKGLTP